MSTLSTVLIIMSWVITFVSGFYAGFLVKIMLDRHVEQSIRGGNKR